MLRLLPGNGEISAGRVLLKGRDLLSLGDEEMRAVRGSELAMIFQDPMTSLNPTFTIGAQMIDAQKAHLSRGQASRSTLRLRSIEDRTPDEVEASREADAALHMSVAAASRVLDLWIAQPLGLAGAIALLASCDVTTGRQVRVCRVSRCRAHMQAVVAA